MTVPNAVSSSFFTPWTGVAGPSRLLVEVISDPLSTVVLCFSFSTKNGPSRLSTAPCSVLIWSFEAISQGQTWTNSWLSECHSGHGVRLIYPPPSQAGIAGNNLHLRASMSLLTDILRGPSCRDLPQPAPIGTMKRHRRGFQSFPSLLQAAGVALTFPPNRFIAATWKHRSKHHRSVNCLRW